jgi:hypothetical protein
MDILNNITYAEGFLVLDWILSEAISANIVAIKKPVPTHAAKAPENIPQKDNDMWSKILEKESCWYH